MDEDVSPFLAELEAEVQVDAAGNPNNKVAFAEENPKNSVVEAVEITDEDRKKYLTEGQRNSLPKNLQDGIIRKKKTQEAEEASMPSFENMRNEYAEAEAAGETPEVSEPSAEEPLPDGPMEELPEPAEVSGPLSEPQPDLPPPADVTMLAERLAQQEQEVSVASMTQRQFEDWMFPSDESHADWASGQISLARILANLKAAGYDANSLSIDDQLYSRYLQVASALWSRQNLVESDRESVMLKVENAPASQIVSMLTATTEAIPFTMAAELFNPVETEPEPTNYLPYAAVEPPPLLAFPFFWRK